MPFCTDFVFMFFSIGTKKFIFAQAKGVDLENIQAKKS